MNEESEIVIEEPSLDEEQAVISLQNIFEFGKSYKIKCGDFNYLLWPKPIQFYASLEKSVKHHPALQPILTELRDIMEEWMNNEESQYLPTDCPYMNSWKDLEPQISSRPSYMTSYHSEPILDSLEKLASKREIQRKKEISAITKQNTGCDTSEKTSKKRKVRV
jgi:hypothetical protein